MGRRGPPKTPTAILKARGSWLVKHRQGEPELPEGRPICPTWLKGESRKYWDQIVAHIESMGVLTEVDQPAVALLVDALAQYCVARDRAEKAGLTTTNTKGYTMAHPLIRVRDKAWERTVKLLTQYGFTPASRAGLRVENPNAQKKKKGKPSILRFPGAGA